MVYQFATVAAQAFRGIEPTVGNRVSGFPIRWSDGVSVDRLSDTVTVDDGEGQQWKLWFSIIRDQDDHFILTGYETYTDDGSVYSNHFAWKFGTFSEPSFAIDYATYVAAGWALTGNYGHCPNVESVD